MFVHKNKDNHAQGVADEQARIIALLASMSDWYYDKAIERIKGGTE